ncbi:hypothetical protein J3R82DRAFT_10439 [Butyriboletus roseoflavus]|nr:hypothetical protein J3R82DRAFT_10439 [Butyriboletus roseoflavus]
MPTLGDICKACAKVPAVLTVVGDIRLGESPCLLCAPCWRNMGPPRGEDAGAGDGGAAGETSQGMGG